MPGHAERDAAQLLHVRRQLDGGDDTVIGILRIENRRRISSFEVLAVAA